MNTTLSSPETSSCGSTSGRHFSLLNTPTTSHCFNLNNTFSNPNVTIPGFQYDLLNTASFNYSTNHSQISYSQPSTASQQPSNLTLKTYNGLDCIRIAESYGLIEPWTEWTCATSSGGECSTLPYSVRSFVIGPSSEKGRKGKCVVAAS
ncbi:hypothetical protein DOTSEDRAFT_26501 [Dothistroma septosporum NZE10]|uniref:Uncharacterized protein n=1 Tax=Dothistroma septosporum (strain NZE10 / CBS 128990) TaxID=675120 RepID=N1PFD0_DOTSN|nr:hypothetical protein DOTSEDRAFT_26501 [Dothistroma septosporum NZE10]